MPDFQRDLQILADDQPIARGCRAILTAPSALTLRPIPKSLEIHDLSDSSAALLAAARQVEIRSGSSVLARGELIDVFTRVVSGTRITTAAFAPGLSLWQSCVSLSVASGMKVSETIRALLAAASYPFPLSSSASSSSDAHSAASAASVPSSVSSSAVPSSASSSAAPQSAASLSASLSATSCAIPLAAFAAEDPTLSRPQSFFGRTCDALALLADTADADIFLAPAGICVSGRSRREISTAIPEKDLLSEPLRIGSRLLLSTAVIGWLPGACIQTQWKGVTFAGRIVSNLIQADNVSGPWKAELELEI